MMTQTYAKHFKILAHMIIVKAKEQKQMKRFDYQHTVVPYYTLLKEKPVAEKYLLSGFRRQGIAIVK